MDRSDPIWDRVQGALSVAHAIAWDTCHKIYISMDPTETQSLRDLGYHPVIEVNDPVGALITVMDWYEDSCGLRFVQAVRTAWPGESRNDRFVHLIHQIDNELE